jgi:hypothetical protein
MAVSSGVTGLEAAVVVTDVIGAGATEPDASAVRDLGGPDVPVYRADASGAVHDVVRT